MFNLERIAIILVNTSHPGNIGSVARAMKNMGLKHLRLVNPKMFPHPEATALASGASDVLIQAKLFSDLKEAIKDQQLIYAFSSRSRHLEWPPFTPRECVDHIAEEGTGAKIALVFGNERAGLTNEELSLCQFHVSIPTHSDYPSLNLAQAVQVIAYELWVKSLSESKPQLISNKLAKKRILAPAEQIEGFFQHLEQTLVKIKVLHPHQNKKMILRLRRLFHRAQLDSDEINILRGILKAINQSEDKLPS